MAYPQPQRDKLLENYSAMITTIMERASVPFHLHKDIRQDCYLEMFRAFDKYDNTKAKFSTFLWWRIRTLIQTKVLKYEYPYGKSTYFYRNNPVFSVPINNEIQFEQQINIDDNLIVKLFCDKLNKKFSAKECELIIQYYLQNETWTTLRKKFGNVARSVQILKRNKLNEIFTQIKTECGY